MKLNELKNGAVVETRNGDKFLKVDNTFLNLKQLGLYMSLAEYNDDLSFIRGSDWDIVRVNNDVDNGYGYINEAVYNVIKHNKWTWERPEPTILNESEKEYLKAVCKSLKVKSIVKENFSCNKQFISLTCLNFIGNIEVFSFPIFKADTMYTGMELGKHYTLEELGIK